MCGEQSTVFLFDPINDKAIDSVLQGVQDMSFKMVKCSSLATRQPRQPCIPVRVNKTFVTFTKLIPKICSSIRNVLCIFKVKLQD